MKYKLLDILNLKNEPKIYKDPIFKLVNNESEIKNDSNSNPTFTKLLYFNRGKIHSNLYENYDIININDRLKDNIYNILSFIFYLVLLIQDQPNIINYIYSLYFIKKVYNNHENNNNNHLYKIINSKLILDLLNNYKNIEIYEENQEEKKIEDENQLIIKNNINYLEDIGINLNVYDIMTKNIEDIYSEIIISLIKNDKFSDDIYINEILSSLDIENIDLTEKIFHKLKEGLDKNRDYLKKYRILNIYDLTKDRIIDFYYILFKYILKNTIYIYQFPFLLENRKKILSILKSNNLKILDVEENLKNRMNYVIEHYLDLPFYYNCYITKIRNNYSIEYEKIKNNRPISISNDINSKKSTLYLNDKSKSTQNEIKSQKSNENYLLEEKNLQRQILNYSTFTLHTNERGQEPFIIYDKITIGKQEINVINYFFQMIKEKKERILDINFQKFLEFLEKFVKKIKIEYKYNYCLRLKLIFQNTSKFLNYNISCKYIFYSPIEKNNELIFKEENIFDKNSTESDGFNYLIAEINNDYYKEEKYEYKECENINNINSVDNSKKINSKIITINRNDNNRVSVIDNNITNNKDLSTKLNTVIDINYNASKEEIISYIKVIFIHRKSAKYFGQLNNGFYLSYGGDNSIFIFGQKFELKTEIKNLDDIIYNVYEKKSQYPNKIEIIACCNKNLNLIILNKSNLQYNIKQYQIPDIICLVCCDMNNNNYIISGESIVVGFKDLFDPRRLSKMHKYIQKTFRSGININNKIVALTSNSLIKNGEDTLLLCNIEEQKIEKKIIGCSHVYEPNGLAVMNIGNKTILLAGCKKYFPNQNNGILIVDIPKEKEDKIKETFVDTESFEVNSICPIYDFQNNNNIINLDNIDEESIDNFKKKSTNFFLAGGFRF